MKIFTKRKIFAFVFFVIVLAIFILYKKYNLSSDSTFDYILAHAKIGWLIFIALYAGTVLILAIPETPFTIAAGILFPYWIGVSLVIIGTMIGSMAAFLVSRYIFHDYFHKKLAHTKYLKWTKIKDQNHLTKITLIARVTPFIPFNLSNYAFAMTKIKTNNYFTATLIGTLPAIFLLVFVGNKLEKIIQPEWAMAFTISCIIVVLFYIFKDKFSRRKKEKLIKPGLKNK